MKKRVKKGYSPRNRLDDDFTPHQRARKRAVAKKDQKTNLRNLYNYDPEKIEEEYEDES